MFPKHADPAKVQAHHEHIHSHFDLSLLGMSLEHWAIVFVLFGLLQVRLVRRRCRLAALDRGFLRCAWTPFSCS